MENKFKIEVEVLNDYVNSINLSVMPMSQIKMQLDTATVSNSELFRSIKNMLSKIKELITSFPNEKLNMFTDIIKQIMNANNGVISTRMLEPLNISRQYLTIMEKNNIIEKVSRGIYISSSDLEDSYFCFQQKYKKAVFSHMNALYFYGMTEEFPYSYTVTVPQNYHVDNVNMNCNVFYVSSDIYDLGITEIKTPNGNIVRVYDKERCICDIIRSKGRMDLEQVKKAIKQYLGSNEKNMARLTLYAKKMGINEKVIKMVSDYE